MLAAIGIYHAVNGIQRKQTGLLQTIKNVFQLRICCCASNARKWCRIIARLIGCAGDNDGFRRIREEYILHVHADGFSQIEHTKLVSKDIFLIPRNDVADAYSFIDPCAYNNAGIVFVLGSSCSLHAATCQFLLRDVCQPLLPLFISKRRFDQCNNQSRFTRICCGVFQILLNRLVLGLILHCNNQQAELIGTLIQFLLDFFQTCFNGTRFSTAYADFHALESSIVFIPCQLLKS